MRTCTCCKETKSLDFFSKNSRNKTDGRQPKCKACNSAYEKENFERIQQRSKAYRERVKDTRNAKHKVYRDKRRKEKGAEIKEYYKKYYAKNKERLKMQRLPRREKEREGCRRYNKNNRPLIRALNSKRKAMLKQAIPLWVNLNLIREIYEKAAALSESTGIFHEVDHIVPIRSKIVCGLHCQQNLQILTGEENNSKGNRYWPDMP